MNQVEILASVISAVANGVGAQTIVDVGAGQVWFFLERYFNVKMLPSSF